MQVSCVGCGFPIATSGAEGASIDCPSCGTSGILATKVGQAISVPGPLFFGTLGFVLGVFFAPAMLKMAQKLGEKMPVRI